MRGPSAYGLLLTDVSSLVWATKEQDRLHRLLLGCAGSSHDEASADGEGVHGLENAHHPEHESTGVENRKLAMWRSSKPIPS
jgi:hypothetical protein